MRLLSAINQHLSDSLLAQLAVASAMPVVAARAYCAVAVPVLVRQLTIASDADELTVRWDMCRQLFVSQVLKEPAELLRTDLGWPNRRHHLTQRVLGTQQVTTLTESTAQPTAAMTLLGYLTIMALATVGEQAYLTDLSPMAFGPWLQEQGQEDTIDARPSPPADAPVLATAPAVAEKLAAPRTASKRGWVLAGVLTLVSAVGIYFFLNTTDTEPAPVVASRPAVTAPARVVASPPAVVPPAEQLAPAVVAAPAVAVPVTTPKHHATPAAAALRDTVGNAALARQIGGRFNVALGRYPKGEGQPLIIKLINRATLTVGINSTESLLYKRLVNRSLPRPSDIALDRLAFDLGQARLGAEGAQQLGNVASLLKTFPKVRLLVVGHANNQEAQAIRLGLQRATAAVDELVKQGISADRLQAQGRLSTELPTENDSYEKQAMLQGISLRISRL